MEVFQVVAHLYHGAVLDPRVGVALDSLLASQIRQRAKIEQGLSGQELDGGLSRLDNTVKVVELPLQRCEDPTNPQRWHWMATTAVPVDHDGNIVVVDTPHVNTIIQSAHVSEMEESVSKLQGVVSNKSGRWKGNRIPVITTPAAALVWKGVGDVDEVADLLYDLDSVGHRRNAGEGAIRSWEIKSCDTDPLAAGHLNPVQPEQIGRPCFEHCLAALHIAPQSVYQSRVGVRPPYWHPGTQEAAFLPSERGINR